jgi:hypothetical protein
MLLPSKLTRVNSKLTQLMMLGYKSRFHLAVFTNDELRKIDDSVKGKYAEKRESTSQTKTGSLFDEMKDLYEDTIEILDKEGKILFLETNALRKYFKIISKANN